MCLGQGEQGGKGLGLGMKPPPPILTACVSWPRDTTPFPAAPKWLYTRSSEPSCRQHTAHLTTADAEKTLSSGEGGGPEVLVWAGRGHLRGSARP